MTGTASSSPCARPAPPSSTWRPTAGSATAGSPKDRLSLCKAYIAKAVWDFPTTRNLIDDLLARHKPQYVVILVGSSEVKIGHPERSDFEANYARLIKRVLAAGSIPVAATLPPCSHLEPWAWIYNTEMYQSSKMNRVPLIDVREMMRDADFEIANIEPTDEKVPPAEAVQKNRFAGEVEAVVQGELDRIVRQIEAK